MYKEVSKKILYGFGFGFGMNVSFLFCSIFQVSILGYKYRYIQNENLTNEEKY